MNPNTEQMVRTYPSKSLQRAHGWTWGTTWALPWRTSICCSAQRWVVFTSVSAVWNRSSCCSSVSLFLQQNVFFYILWSKFLISEHQEALQLHQRVNQVVPLGSTLEIATFWRLIAASIPPSLTCLHGLSWLFRGWRNRWLNCQKPHIAYVFAHSNVWVGNWCSCVRLWVENQMETRLQVERYAVQSDHKRTILQVSILV